MKRYAYTAMLKDNPEVIRQNDLGGNAVDLLVVCAPCQQFSSLYRKQNQVVSTRLILQAVRFAQCLSPKLIFFENVPGLASPRFSPIVSELRMMLDMIGYRLGRIQRVEAADFGVPQRRLRCVMLAEKGEVPPEFLGSSTSQRRRVTVSDAIRDLPVINSGESDAHDPLHFARSHRPIALERLHHIPKDGGSRDSLPGRLELQCHRDYKGHPDVYGRMGWDDIAPTLTTGCTDVTRGRFAHPESDRAITLREAARLQTFPDSYQFSGTAKEIATQIGNAVPIRLIQAIAPTLRAGCI